MFIAMTERDKILACVREALRVVAPFPGYPHGTPPATLDARPSTLHSTPRQWLPAVGETLDDRLALFQRNAGDLKAKFVLLNGREDLATSLIELRDTEGWEKIGAHTGQLTD